MYSPRKGYLDVVCQILCHLKRYHLQKGYYFRKHEDRGVVFYTNVGLVEDTKSTTGYCTKVKGNLATWRKKQTVMAKSSAEAEYTTSAQGVLELI